LAKLIASHTGISQQDAEKRVDAVLAQMKAAQEKAKQAADAARKASASTSFFLFFSMLIGAFIASVAGALGGRQRDL
jgi:Trk-type K+ transport system membrane component